jgi:hypothetical protein
MWSLKMKGNLHFELLYFCYLHLSSEFETWCDKASWLAIVKMDIRQDSWFLGWFNDRICQWSWKCPMPTLPMCIYLIRILPTFLDFMMSNCTTYSKITLSLHNRKKILGKRGPENQWNYVVWQVSSNPENNVKNATYVAANTAATISPPLYLTPIFM